MNTQTTADLVLSALQHYDLKLEPNGQYRFNSPFRPGSNSYAVRLKIDDDGEHGAWIDNVTNEGGSLYQLADMLGIPRTTQPASATTSAPTTKRGYSGLDEYAAAHYAPADAFTAAGWKATRTACPETRQLRPALEIPTTTGPRYRFTDGNNPPFKSPAGYKACWYRLAEAIAIANATEGVIVLCNGEPSTVVAQYYQVPATCITGSGEKRLPDALLSELRAAWQGPIVVALDSDKKGRDAAPGLVAQLQAVGYDATAVDMRGTDGFDLADWCGLHDKTALADLLACQVPEDPKEQFSCSDLGNARRMVAQHGADLRFVKGWDWLAWDGKRWRIDDTGEVDRRAQSTARAIYQEATDAPDHKRQALARHAIASESAGKITSMIRLAESQPEIRATPESFDANDWLLTCSNGTIDLRSGELLPHDRAHMLTKAISVAYHPQARAPQWLAFLDRIFAGNQDLIGYVQRMMGYMLTGSTGAQCMFIAHGKGANGKSVLIDVIRALLGDYARNADPSTFLAQQSERIRSDLARLAGVRFVSTVELDEGRRLSEALVKQVTGGDPITSAFKFKDEFEFMPRFKLLMATNHKPVIKGTDYAIWRRIKLIPFGVTIPEDERDEQLTDKLKTELPGILAWTVRGCLDWQRDGLNEPTDVRAATNAYRAEQDVIGQFIDECCIEGPRMQVATADLYAAYAKWCDDGGERGVNQRRFAQQMTERGVDRVRSRSGWFYIGVGLLDPNYNPPAGESETPQGEKCDPRDPRDPNSGNFTREEHTKERSGKLDHEDHEDHTSDMQPAMKRDPAYRAGIPTHRPDVNERLAREAQERAAAIERIRLGRQQMEAEAAEAAEMAAMSATDDD